VRRHDCQCDENCPIHFFFCVEFGCKINCLSVFLDKNSDYLNIFYLFMCPFSDLLRALFVIKY
jgi:hypothetical protein